MFQRIRETVAILREPTDGGHFRQTQIPRTDAEARGERRPENPALNFMGVLAIVVFTVFVFRPFVHNLLKIEGTANSVLTVGLGVILAMFWEKLEKHLYRIKLDPLSPYFGHKLNHAARVLKGK